jgi:hypothetical protein
MKCWYKANLLKIYLGSSHIQVFLALLKGSGSMFRKIEESSSMILMSSDSSLIANSIIYCTLM